MRCQIGQTSDRQLDLMDEATKYLNKVRKITFTTQLPNCYVLVVALFHRDAKRNVAVSTKRCAIFVLLCASFLLQLATSLASDGAPQPPFWRVQNGCVLSERQGEQTKNRTVWALTYCYNLNVLLCLLCQIRVAGGDQERRRFFLECDQGSFESCAVADQLL